MNYDELIKSTKIYKSIIKDKQNDKFSHCYLLSINNLDILKSFVDLFKYIVFCENDICNKCSNCIKIKTDNHSDIKVYENKNNKRLQKDDIKNIFDDAYITPVEGNKKLLIVNFKDKVDEVIQNKLLKLFEEPPKNVIILITTTNISNVLNTIKSRSNILEINEFSKNDIIEFLDMQEIDDEKKSFCINNCLNDINLIDRIINEEDFYNLYIEVLKCISRMNSSRDVIYYRNVIDKENIKDFFVILENIMKNVIVKNDKDYRMKVINDIYKKSSASKILENIYLNKPKLNVYCNADNLYDFILFKILEVKYICQK